MNMTKLHQLSILGTCIILSACSSLFPTPDISHIKRIEASEVEQCKALSKNIRDSQAHSFYHDNNMLDLLRDAAIKTARENGNAYLVKSLQMDYDHNRARIMYQIFSCPEKMLLMENNQIR